MNNTTFILPASCTNLNQTVHEFCLPPMVSCSLDPVGLLAYCEDINCGDKCNELPYFFAYVPGDKIQFQSRFYDTANSIGSMGIDYETFFDEIKLCTSDGEISGVDLEPFVSRKMMAFSGARSYQIIEIDTNQLSANTWSLFLKKGDREVCSYSFRKEECVNTVKIGSPCKKSDCFGLNYGQPDAYNGDMIDYNNSIRLFGSFGSNGFSNEVEVKNNKRRVKVQDNYSLTLKGLVPKFVTDILSNQMFDCGIVAINDEAYLYGSINVNKKISGRFRVEISSIYRGCQNANKRNGC